MSFANFYRDRLPAMLRQIKRIKHNSTPKFYAVAVGRRVGIYRSWPSCKVQISGISNAKYRRFDDHLSALKYLSEAEPEDPIQFQDFIDHSELAKLRQDIVYTDGACWRNGLDNACAGVGAYWPNSPEQNISETIGGRQTSIRAELYAVIYALRRAKQRDIQCLTIFTDSNFVIQTATVWLKKWKQNGWRTSAGAEVKNKQDLMALDEAIADLEHVIWRSVSAHTGVEGNEYADRLANEAISRLRDSGLYQSTSEST